MKQKTALGFLKTGANVFLTGEPGSGKTHTINAYVSYLRDHGIEPAITASTGIAATHIGGMTIHSWTGIGIKKVLSEMDLDKLSQNERLVRRAEKTPILIIDEISMLDAQTLTAVDQACKALKSNDAPFGGMQIVFVGDFFQLPPIVRDNNSFGGGSDDGSIGRQSATLKHFAFYSQSWKEADPVVCYLSEQHRHVDQELTSLLNSLRFGELNGGVHETLKKRLTPHLKSEAKDKTRLYAHNVNVDDVNARMLSSLPGEEKTFDAVTRGAPALVDQIKRGCLSPERLYLKVGAQVMFTKNSFEDGYVNGTLGEVVGFTPAGGPKIRTKKGKVINVTEDEWSISDGDKILARFTQLPLRLAWAITIHKSQGMTLDEAIIDLSQVFEFGQGYVALSRVKTLSGLHLIGYNDRSLEVHPDILKIDGAIRKRSEKYEEAFYLMPQKEISSAEENFIKACGGSLEKISPTEKKKKDVEAKKTTQEITLGLFREGKHLSEISEVRELTEGTVLSHFEDLVATDQLKREELERLVGEPLVYALKDIHALFKKTGTERLKPVFDKLNGEFTYDQLKLARLLFDGK